MSEHEALWLMGFPLINNGRVRQEIIIKIFKNRQKYKEVFLILLSIGIIV